MTRTHSYVAVAALTLLAGCTAESTARPYSTDSVGPPSQMPQPANSLPLGSTVAAPVLSPGDGLITTSTGPGASALQPTSAAPGSSPRAYPPRRSQ